MHDIIPDIMTTGKPLGNGHPLAIAVASKEIVNSLGILHTMVNMGYAHSRNNNGHKCVVVWSNVLITNKQCEQMARFCIIFGYSQQ